MIAPWDHWLANFANETLKTFNAFSPPDLALQKLREALIGRREHWRAEGRRNVALQEANQARLASSNSEGGASKTIAQQDGFQEAQQQAATKAVPTVERRAGAKGVLEAFQKQFELAGAEAKPAVPGHLAAKLDADIRGSGSAHNSISSGEKCGSLPDAQTSRRLSTACE